MRRNLPVIEPIAVPDTFVSGVLSVDDLGGDLFRVTAYAIQRCPEGECAVIVSRHVMHASTLHEGSLEVHRHSPEHAN